MTLSEKIVSLRKAHGWSQEDLAEMLDADLLIILTAVEKVAVNFRKENENVSAKVSEMLDMIPVTKAHGLESEEIANIENKIDNLRQTGIQLDKHGVRAGGEMAFNNFRYLLKLGHGLTIHGATLQIHTDEGAGAET